MKFNSILRSLALAAALASTVPLLAKPFAKTINIAQSAKIGKADLQAGEYRLMIDGNKATVQKGRQTIVESEGRWEDRSSKAANDSVLIGEDGQVKEVRFFRTDSRFCFQRVAREFFVTPFERTRGRPLATVASLLVELRGQVLKWQEPASATAETMHRLLRFSKRPQRTFSSFRNML